MSSALIPLQGQLPQFTSPITNLSQLLQAKDLASQIQMRQAQAGDIDAQRQQRNRDLQDQNTIQELMKDPAVTAKLATGDVSPISGKVQPKTLAAVQKAQSEALAAQQTRTEQQRKIHSDALKSINESVANLLQLTDKNGQPDINQINARLPSTIQNLNAAGAFKDANIDVSQLPQSVASVDPLKGFLASSSGLTALIDHSLAQKESAAKAAKALADANIATSQAQNQTPEGLLPEQKVQAAQAEATLAQTHSRDLQTAAHQRAEEGEANTRAALEGQRVNLEQLRINLEKGGMTANQVNQAATKAAQPYQKMTDAANTTLGKIDETLNLVKAGASGQELAKIGIIPALTGMNRINHTEINAQGSGSRGIEGNIESFLSKIAGQGSLTADQKAQMTALLNQAKNHITSRQQIVNDHLDALGTSNSREEIEAHEHNTRQKLAAFEGGQGTSAVTPQIQAVFKDAAPGIHKLSDGTTWKKDKDGTITPQ